MKKRTRPEKIENVIGKTKQSIALGLYRYTAHAENRKYERKITEEDALYVLENGWRVPSKDDFSEEFKNWKYAVEGYTLQDELLRVAIAFDENMLLIITVINITKNK